MVKPMGVFSKTKPSVSAKDIASLFDDLTYVLVSPFTKYIQEQEDKLEHFFLRWQMNHVLEGIDGKLGREVYEYFEFEARVSVQGVSHDPFSVRFLVMKKTDGAFDVLVRNLTLPESYAALRTRVLSIVARFLKDHGRSTLGFMYSIHEDQPLRDDLLKVHLSANANMAISEGWFSK